MKITMVKKRLASGEPCPKCAQAEELLRRRGLWERVDERVWADEADPSSAGWALAAEHDVALAPFFVVTRDGAAPEVFTSALAFVKWLSSDADAPAVGGPPADAEGDVEALARELEGAAPQRIVDRALERFGAGCAIAFSGAEDVVLIDLAARTGRPFSVFTLDTGRLHPETYAFIEKVREHYGVTIELMSPRAASLETLVRDKGLFSFYRDGHGECCGIRKVEPLERALSGRAAWITGLRPDQSPATRSGIPTIEHDARFSTPGQPKLVKINPLASWSADDVWAWIRTHDVPYNPLHERGFRSIGCEPCTRPVHPGQHEREGRWWWEEATRRECGLHLEG